ncbi:ribonuclease HII [Thecamonas trahens ATCC 50062]|uniref:Ribonuclease n=1 Tax=Thecamonas trahens ATCC 50062 TaxID=461836 RepID=A0A0L0DJN0_THETB|nr:ribonuclease HII [Thecamonas trahens ATCC 50062]KNC52614.1 ribonuclease HII [Thecamonas trahens ATCC 50062]|eukprot:XP_013755172.1 ribonuclease HII [Thecamonas trahens ATCC 50062]
MGIDEAGRGPALGPMVYGAAYCPVAKKDALKKMKFDDSKALTAETRERMYAEIGSEEVRERLGLGFKIHSLSPEELSGKMLRVPKYNLNTISHDTAIGLIRWVLAQGVNLQEVFVDTVGSPTKYEAHLSRLFPQLKIAVRKKADALYPIVSAASICAKVARDLIVENWVFAEPALNAEGSGVSRVFGSGYPGDPNTKKWLAGSIDPVFGFPSIARFSWAPCRKLLEAKAAPVSYPFVDSDSDDDDDDDELAAMEEEEQTSLSEFFGAAGSGSGGAGSGKRFKRAPYFRDRQLVYIDAFN